MDSVFPEKISENQPTEPRENDRERKSEIGKKISLAVASTMLLSQVLGAKQTFRQQEPVSVLPEPVPLTAPMPEPDAERQTKYVGSPRSYTAPRSSYTYEDYFAYEFNSQKYFREIIELKEIIDNLPGDFERNFGDYLRQTDWYYFVEKNLGLEGAINMINITNVEGQPLQCVGLAVLLSNLKDPNLSIQNIGGAKAFDVVGAEGAQNAIEFVPYELIENKYRNIVPNDYGGVTIRTSDFEVSDFEVGDVVVLGDRGKIIHIFSPDNKPLETHIGHVAVVIGETSFNGRDMILVAESNRNNDGRITITLVDNKNLTETLDPGANTFVIRTNRVYNNN